MPRVIAEYLYTPPEKRYEVWYAGTEGRDVSYGLYERESRAKEVAWELSRLWPRTSIWVVDTLADGE